jgi:minor extracellular serine protease Vpr
MKKVLTILILFSIFQINASASIDKLDTDLRMVSLSLQNKNVSIPLPKSVTYNPNVVDVFIKTSSIDAVKEMIERNNGKVLGTYGPSILTARIPYKVVDILHQMPEVVKMESAKVVSIKNTKAKTHIGADKVHTGQNPLPKAFTGKGVLVGILDTGIDFLHKEFFQKDDPTKTRVIAIYDTELGDQNPPPFGLPYGLYFNKEEIQATVSGTSTIALSTKDVAGHGTHVAATAAGLSGIAPDAEIVAVRTLNRIEENDIYSSLSSEILISMEFVEEIAKIEKKPLVYNLSLGITQGIRDGSDLASQALDELLARNPQTICVVAAGNEGEDRIHWGGNLTTSGKSSVYMSALGYNEFDEVSGSFTARIPIADTGTCFIDISPISITNQLNLFFLLFNFPIANFELNTEVYAKAPKISLSELLRTPVLTKTFKLESRNSIDCSYELSAKLHQDVVELTVVLKDNTSEVEFLEYNNFDIFLFGIEGTQNAHLWKNDGNGAFIEFPTLKGLLDAQGLLEPDLLMNIGTFPTLAKNVIVVGAYSNMLNFTNRFGNSVSFGGINAIEGSIAPFSSNGPSADGRVKPDITAPGHNIISARSQYADFEDRDKAQDTTYVVSSGTSMSSPVVCGALALLLEQNPNLTVEEIRDLLIKTADKDGFTGTVPNPTWGWGKLNIFAAMQRLIVSVAEKNISSTLKVFPSVATSSFSVCAEQAEEMNEVFLVNSLGETLEWKKADKLQLQQCEFNVKGLPSGQYYVVVKNQKGVQSQAVQVVK